MLQELQPYLSALIATVALAVSIITASKKALRDKMRWLADRIDVLEDRCTKIEGTLAHLPDKDSTHRLETAVTELQGQINVIAERVKPISSIADRLQEFLLEKARSS
ncbi:MAG: DUF2730 family protein [Xanthobacteraceae bacterium]